MRRRALLIAAALLSTACDARRVVRVQPTGLDFDLTFAVIADDAGAPLRVLDPFGIDNATTPAPVLVPIDLEHEQLFLVGLDLEDLRVLVPELVLDPAAIKLTLATPPPQPIRRADQQRILSDRSLPSETPILRLEDRDPAQLLNEAAEPAESAGSTASLRAKLTLTLPIDPEYCGEDRPQVLRPFDAQNYDPVPLTRLLRLDADRVLALARSPGALYLYRRNAPRVALELSTPGVDFVLAGGFAVLPNLTTVLIAAEKKLGDDRSDGVIYEVELSGDTFGLARTATVARDRPLYDILYDQTGNTIAVGEQGLVLAQSAGDSRYLERPRPPLVDIHPELMRIVAGTPHFAGGAFRAFQGDAVRGTWSLEQVAPLEGEKLRLEDLAVSSASDRYAVGAPSSFFRAAPNGPLARVVWPDVPRFRGCMNTAINEPVGLNSVVARGSEAYVASDCGALLRVRGPEVCVSIAELEGRAIELGGAAVTSLTFSHGLLTAGDADGRLWEADLSE